MPFSGSPDTRPVREREVQATLDSPGSREKTGSVLLIEGKHFVKTLSLHSLVANSEKIGKDYYEQARSAVLKQFVGNVYRDEMSFGWKLITIIFEVMPYFIKKNRGLERRKFGKEEMLKLIAEKVDLPPGDVERTNTFFDLKPLQKALKEVEK